MFGPPPFLGPLYPNPHFTTSSQSIDSTTIAVPVSVLDGDVLLLVDYAVNTFSSPITKVVPAGFTEISSMPANGIGRRLTTSCRIAPAGYGAAVLTGQAGDRRNRKFILAFRGGKRPTSLTPVPVNDQIVGGSPPSSQTLPIAGLDSPVIAFAVYAVGPPNQNQSTSISDRPFTISGQDVREFDIGFNATGGAEVSVWVAGATFSRKGAAANAVATLGTQSGAYSYHLHTDYITLA